MLTSHKSGFTLIELSIVLVIVGLIIGGILGGRDLIRAAAVHAQITQIQNIQAAANVFEDKYLALPGDIPNRLAMRFGLTPRGSQRGQGDGNGLIEGDAAGGHGTYGPEGEPGMFWVDLTTANGQNFNLIAGAFSVSTPTGPSPVNVVGTQISEYFPAAKIGNSNYVYVWSGGINVNDNRNYLSVSEINSVQYGYAMYGTSNIPVSIAYAIDRKIDDGAPQSGAVTAMYLSWRGGGVSWAIGGGGVGVDGHTPGGSGAAPGTAATASASTCYDNGGIAAAQMAYSVSQNGGSGANCALSFVLQ